MKIKQRLIKIKQVNTFTYFRTYISVILFITLVSSFNLTAETIYIDVKKSDTLRPKYLVTGNFGLNSYSSNFTSLPNVGNCCPKFLDASGSGMNFGLGYEMPFLKSSVDGLLLGLQIGLTNRNANYSVTEATRITDGTQSISGTFAHKLDISLSYLDITPYLSYQIIDNLFLSAGVGFGLVISSTYNQSEQLVEPTSKGYFIDSINNMKSRIRNEKSGDIENVASLISANLGLGYELPLNKTNTLKIRPEVNYNFSASNVVSNLDWKVNTLKLGMSIIYTPFETIYQKNEIYNIDTIKIENENINENYVGIGKYTMDTKVDCNEYLELTTTNYFRIDTLNIAKPKTVVLEKEESKPIIPEKIEYEEEISGKLMILNPKNKNQEIVEIKAQIEFVEDVYPLLPYIFFEEMSPTFPQRYKKYNDANDFDITTLDPNPIDYHKNNLNIIGYRMQQNSQIKLIVKGYIDPTTEANNCELAAKRAENVKNYLVNTFKLDGSRITTKVNSNNCFPPDVTRTQSEDGYSENRRVELESNVPELLFSLSNQRYQRPSMLIPDEIIIAPNFENMTVNKKNKEIKSRNKFAYWSYIVDLDGSEITKENGIGDTKDISYVLPYKLIRDAKNDSKLTIEFTATDPNKNNFTDSKILALTKDTSEYEIESLTLTVFEVSQYNLDDRIKKEIKKFFTEIGAGASVYIKGYSDNLGDLEANKRLSQTRANAVRDYIKSIASKVEIIESVGVGSDEFPPGVRTYETPEERFISRTVQIEIKKELQKK